MKLVEQMLTQMSLYNHILNNNTERTHNRKSEEKLVVVFFFVITISISFCKEERK